MSKSWILCVGLICYLPENSTGEKNNPEHGNKVDQIHRTISLWKTSKWGRTFEKRKKEKYNRGLSKCQGKHAFSLILLEWGGIKIADRKLSKNKNM